MADWCKQLAAGVRISVQVSPNARKAGVAGMTGDALRIRLQAPPTEGRANEALIDYLAEELAVPKSAISLLRGHAGRRKVVEVNAVHLTAAAVEQIFSSAADGK